MPPLKSFACLCGFALLLPRVLAVEPVALAGKIVQTDDALGISFFALKSARTDEVVAVLQGQDLSLRIDETVILQAETTGLSYLGLPILNVVDVLVGHWEMPAIWRHYAKGFGPYSGFGQEPRAEDYVRAPYEETRAYDHDCGQVLSSLSLSVSSFSLPPVVLQAKRDPAGVAISWDAGAAIRYDLISSSNVSGPYHFVTNILQVVPGQISLKFPATNAAEFYRVHY